MTSGKKKRMKKQRFTLLILIVILAGLGIIKWTWFPSRADQNGRRTDPRAGVLPVSVLDLHLEDYNDTIVTNGVLLASESVEIRAETSGKIVSIHFAEGAFVEKNTLLIKIDDSELLARELSAHHRVSLARATAKRQQTLYDKKMTSQEELDSALNELDLAGADLQLIQTQIAKTEIRAPFKGFVGIREVSPGAYITPSTTITSLVDRSEVRVDFTVPERHSASIATGNPVIVRVNSSGQSIEGTIVARDASIDSQTHTLRLQARLANGDGFLIPGTSAAVTVPLPVRRVIMVPAGAIIPELKGHRVFLFIDGKAVSRVITIGVRTPDRVEIVSGLHEGDRLITSGLLQLREGMSVQREDDSLKLD